MSLTYIKDLSETSQNTCNIKEKWKLELNIIIEDNIWEHICANCHKGTNRQLWKESDWKLKITYFNTPLIISSYVKEPSAALCWRLGTSHISSGIAQ